MRKPHLDFGLEPKKRLLTRDQRKHLEQRIERHSNSLKFGWGEQFLPEPDEVKEARKIIKRWDRRVRSGLETFNKRIGKRAAKVMESLVFDAVDAAIESVGEFEELTRDDFKDSKSGGGRGGFHPWSEP